MRRRGRPAGRCREIAAGFARQLGWRILPGGFVKHPFRLRGGFGCESRGNLRNDGILRLGGVTGGERRCAWLGRWRRDRFGRRRRRGVGRVLFAVFEAEKILGKLFPRIVLVAGTRRILSAAHVWKLIASGQFCKGSYRSPRAASASSSRIDFW